VVYGLILAAGLSTRMGQPKPLMDWGGRPLVLHQVEELRAGGADRVIVVVGRRGDDVARVIPRELARVVHNAAYAQGRAGSLAAGARAIGSDCRAVVIVNVDQPVHADTVRGLLGELESAAAAIVVPSLQGKRGHPVVVAGALLPELRAVREETMGLRAVREAHADELRGLPVEDPWVHLDLNTPAEYEASRP
jgi:molybdenum cofactor cytidylyltransferase